jgi:DNA-binding NtrC family response regulator
MKILVIDDEKDIVDSLRDILEEQGHVVLTAGNGMEGLKHLEQTSNPFGLIIVDLTMPVMDGERFLEAFSERAEASTTPVIVMTATPRIPTSVLPVQILRKPLELEHMLKMVRDLPTPPSK